MTIILTKIQNQSIQSDVQELSKTTHVSRQIKEIIYDSLVLYHSIRKLKLHLEVRRGINSLPISINDTINR